MGGGGPEETHSEECPSEEPEQGSERSKRPRVSFATVETRNFATEGPSETLSSPKERDLSPLAAEAANGPGSTPFAQEQGEPGATPHASRRRDSIDGEALTPGSAELAGGGAMLPVMGESDTESMWIGLPQLGATPRPSCSPGRSEASMMSPVPEAWDIYHCFKSTSEARHSTLSCSAMTDTTCTEAATPAACREVALPCVGNDSAEKRRMAATPAGDEATVDFIGFMGRVLEGTEDCEDEDEGEVPEGRKSFAARKLRQHFASQPLTNLEMATSPERDDEPQPDATTAARLSTASDAQESSLHTSFVSESAPLPCGSSLCYMGPHDTEASPAASLSWRDFLQQSGLSFPEIEPLPRAPAPPEMPRASQLSARWLAYKRALCLSQASSALEERARGASARLAAQIARWDSAAAPHAAALELQQAVGKGSVAAFATKAQRRKAECDAAAKLQYAEAKEEWLCEDLKAAREHSERLRAEKEEQERAARALEEKARVLAATLKQRKARLELNKGLKNMRSMQSALIVPPGKYSSSNKLAAKPQEKQEAKANEPASANAYLAARLRRVLLQQQRLLRTCVLEDRPSASLSSLELSLRGGARCRVARPVAVAPGSLARLTLMLPPLEATSFSVAALRPGAAELRVLARDLFALAWRRLAGALPRSAAVATPTSSVLEITVLCEEVPRLLRSLDEAALRIWGQLESLRKAKRRQPEVLRLEARLTEEEEPAMAISAELMLERRVEREGCEVRVEAARVALEMEASLEAFPDQLDLARACARQLFGAFEAERVARALHCHAAGCREQRPGLAEALALAVEAMRQAA